MNKAHKLVGPDCLGQVFFCNNRTVFMNGLFQVNFIKHVCLPCYTTLSDIFPETVELTDGAK